MRCRPIQPSDLKLVSGWNRQLQIDEGATVMELEAILDRLHRWLECDYEAVVFELDDAPVGYALFRPTDPDLKAPNGLYLRQFFIATRHRRRGIGTAAFREFTTQVVRGRRLVLEVLESNPGGQNFWKSLGLARYSTTFEFPPSAAA